MKRLLPIALFVLFAALPCIAQTAADAIESNETDAMEVDVLPVLETSEVQESELEQVESEPKVMKDGTRRYGWTSETTQTPTGEKTVFKSNHKTTATLVGIVKDSRTYAPLPGAQVITNGTDAITNEHGRFKLGGLTPGMLDIEVRVDGYVNQSQPVSIDGRSAALLVFKMESQEQEEIQINPEDLLKVKLWSVAPTVKAGRQFWVKFEAPDGFEREAWVGLVKKGEAEEIADPEGDTVFYHKYLLHKVTGDLLFKAPEASGNYELRMYHAKENGIMVSSFDIKVVTN